MPNVLEYSKIFQPSLDKQVVHQSVTSWMELNESLVKYNGGDEVKIPSMVMDGLADYDRGNGYVDGAVTLKWDTYKLTQDRGRKFRLDSNDVDETNFVATAGTVMGEFQRTKVVPEIDAYRISRLSAIAISAKQTRGIAITVDNVFDELLKDIDALLDVVGNTTNLKITLPYPILSLLKANDKAIKRMSTVTKADPEKISTAITYIDNHELIPATSSLMKTAFTFNDGTTEGQKVGGFVASGTAKAINWLIAPEKAPIAISKTDKVRVFEPNVNQQADAWDIDYRKYHDVWLPKSQEKSVFVNTTA